MMPWVTSSWKRDSGVRSAVRSLLFLPFLPFLPPFFCFFALVFVQRCLQVLELFAHNLVDLNADSGLDLDHFRLFDDFNIVSLSKVCLFVAPAPGRVVGGDLGRDGIEELGRLHFPALFGLIATSFFAFCAFAFLFLLLFLVLALALLPLRLLFGLLCLQLGLQLLWRFLGEELGTAAVLLAGIVGKLARIVATLDEPLAYHFLELLANVGSFRIFDILLHIDQCLAVLVLMLRQSAPSLILDPSCLFLLRLFKVVTRHADELELLGSQSLGSSPRHESAKTGLDDGGGAFLAHEVFGLGSLLAPFILTRQLPHELGAESTLAGAFMYLKRLDRIAKRHFWL